MASKNGRGRVFFFVFFAVLALLTLYLISPFIGVILLAIVTVLLLRPLYMWLLNSKRLKGRTRLATTITILAFVLIIVIPIFLIGGLLIGGLIDFFEYISSLDLEVSLTNLFAAVEDFLQQIPALGDIELDEEEFLEALKNLALAALTWLSEIAVTLGTSLPGLFVGAIIFLVVMATLLPGFDDLNKRVEEISPLDVSISQLYLRKAEVMILSVLKGVFFLAILQGLIMGVCYWLANVPFAWFWMLLSMVFAILPVVGISFIVLPMAFIFLITGNVTSAVLVLFGFYVIVNPLDLILRPKLVSKEAYLNFTLMLLALFGGIQMAGLLGLIYGPVIMILLLTSLDIYVQYFSGRAGTDIQPDENAEPQPLAESPEAAAAPKS